MKKPEILGAFLRQRRLDLGLTLQQVADQAGTSKSYIWELEQGNSRPGLDMAGTLAGVLEFPLTAYVGYLHKPLPKEGLPPYEGDRRIGERRCPKHGRRLFIGGALPPEVERRLFPRIGYIGRRLPTKNRRS